jgi:2-(1,2-epoxy-1,2-dihydrophenyl)acetyl-CoA isomerase
MSFQTLSLAIDGGVAHITLDRPKNANTIDPPLAAELRSAAERLHADESVRAVLLSGNGPMFCAGGDLGAFAEFGDEIPKRLGAMIEDFHAAVETLSAMDAPLVVAAHGNVMGAGLSMVASASLAVAAEGTRFGMAYTGAGLTPDGSSTYHLPRIIGLRRAEELMLTNRIPTAEEAEKWGIVNQVVPESELLPKARKLADRLAQGPTRAFGRVRKLLLASSAQDLRGQLGLEAEQMTASAGGIDGREGIAAFVGKRAPAFSGRD